MDFVAGLPRSSSGHNGIWVFVDRLTKVCRLVAVSMSWTVDRLANIYVERIVPLHGIPMTIVSDRDPRFTSGFWRSLQKVIGYELRYSSAYHPQTDGQTERTIQTIEDMLRACCLIWGGSWEHYLGMVEFAYNNSYHTSLGMAPYEALYGRPCRTPLNWHEVGERQLVGPELIQQTTEVVKLIKEKLQAAQSRQKSYADVRRRPLQFEVGDFVFLRISPSKGIMRFGKSGKLSPRYVGPFQVIERIGETAYRLDLPADFADVHDIFYVSMLRKCIEDPAQIISYQDGDLRPDMTMPEYPVQITGRKTKKLRNKEIELVKVRWENRLGGEDTWELAEKMAKGYPYLFE